MTTIYKILKWPAIAVVSIISFIVMLMFATSLYWFLNSGRTIKELPMSMADLQKVTVTVKSALITRSPQYITPVEYPTQITIAGELPAKVVTEHPVNSGDQVNIYLTKKDAERLEDKSSLPAFIEGYGIILQNGETLVDPDQFLNGKIEKRVRNASIQGFFGYLLYFGSLAFFIIWKKRSGTKKQSR